MNYQLIKLTPDQLGYRDRGKVKWMGMMLSDHFEALKKMKAENKEAQPPLKAEKNPTENAMMLHQAYTSKQPIRLQPNIIKGGQYLPALDCMVLGFYGEYIHFKKQDHTTFKLQLEQIRYIEWMDPLCWYKKRIK